MKETDPPGGISSRTISWNTDSDKRTVICRLTFSPDVGGSRKPRRATDEIKPHGNNKLQV